MAEVGRIDGHWAGRSSRYRPQAIASLSRPSKRKISGTTRRATDDERSFKLHRFRGVTRFLETFQHRLHGPLAHLVTGLIDRCQRRIVPLGDGDVVVTDDSHVLEHASDLVD
jgi:hypothetical protein